MLFNEHEHSHFSILVEDKNFALFNYVNELNNRVETLQEQISDIKKEIRHFESQGVELESQRQNLLAKIERKRTQADTTGQDYQDKTQATKKVLDQCRTGNIFTVPLSVLRLCTFLRLK